MNKIGILGHGEVGQAIEKVYRDHPKYQIQIKDIKSGGEIGKVDVLNICIPFNDQFVKSASEEILKVMPKLAIIHSTVSPGTTEQVEKAMGGKVAIIHSPIRGVHPNLYEGVKTFVKYIGGNTYESRTLAENHFKELGLRTKTFKNSKTTELGKLLDTTYYGVIIAWHGEMKKICDHYGLDFDEVATEFNTTYNEGYTKLGKTNVVRPVLYAPKDNTIGGHCVLPNMHILEKDCKSKAFELLGQYEKKS